MWQSTNIFSHEPIRWLEIDQDGKVLSPLEPACEGLESVTPRTERAPRTDMLFLLDQQDVISLYLTQDKSTLELKHLKIIELPIVNMQSYVAFNR